MNKNNWENQLIGKNLQTDNNSGFLLGTISVILLIFCIGILVIFNNKKVQRIITEKINIEDVNKIENKNNESVLLLEKVLSIKSEHSNGAIGRLTKVSLDGKNTFIEIAITNGFGHRIYLNIDGESLILVDNLGNKYNFKPPLDNPYIKIESSETFKGELVFKGGVTANANNLTLITNNQIGSDHPFTRRPKMQFYIPINQEDKVILG